MLKPTRVKLLLLVPVLAVLLAGCEGGEFVRSIQLTNEYRLSQGVHPVLDNPTLRAKAQNWADVLAAQGRLVHSNLADGAGPGWRALGENLAMARSVEEAQSLFVNSGSHRATLTSARYNQVGVGVTYRNGYYYVVQVFGG
ncbi:MAG: CAP domain-containing protein [Microthrixaceae bacterium]